LTKKKIKIKKNNFMVADITAEEVIEKVLKAKSVIDIFYDVTIGTLLQKIIVLIHPDKW